MANDILLFIGGVNRATVQGESERTLVGERCFSPAIASSNGEYGARTRVLLDSGAFTDKPEKRLTPDRALERQMTWEARYGHLAFAAVSYDRLIDETWIDDIRHKRRWTLAAADSAVKETVEAAIYLSGQREKLAGRHLILSAQGVDSVQYSECASEILKAAIPGDWFGLGGWCIIGRNRRMLPEFWRTMRLVVPRVAQYGLSHIHIFGVLWDVALGGLLWLCDQYGIELSTDSAAPIVACTYPDMKKAGVRRPYWRDNVEWWRTYLGHLRQAQYYTAPPVLDSVRQLSLW